jgi:hypothetical protein
MPNPSGRIVTLVFIAGAIVGGLAIYLSRSIKPVVVTTTAAPCGQGTGHVVITVLTVKPYVNCQGVTLGYHDSIEWNPSPGVTSFDVDFKGGKKPFKDQNHNPTGHFAEKPGESSGDADDPCPGPGNDYCAYYFSYSISVNKGTPYDPGVIITKP